MKDLGLHFTIEMVRAIMAGTKVRDSRPMTERNPFGVVGDTIWVRETWASGWTYGGNDPVVFYRSTGDGHIGSERWAVRDVMSGKFGIPSRGPVATAPDSVKWRPSIHMPRWASRIDLIVKAVRTQRLGDMTEEEARAEGVGSLADFRALWASIYSKRGLGWEAGRVVRVCEFEVKR